MKSTTPMRIRVGRFITDRYAYRTDPNYVVATACWPIFVVASAMAGALK